MSRCSPGSTLRSLIVLCLAAALVVPLGCGRASDDDASEGEGSVARARATVETDGLPVLLDLGSDSCTACKTMAPILDEMREEFGGRMDVRFIDVRKDRDAASRHGVQVIPTQIFFDEHGHELFRHQGFYSREDILGKWSELGYEFDETAASEGARADG